MCSLHIPIGLDSMFVLVHGAHMTMEKTTYSIAIALSQRSGPDYDSVI